MTPPAIRAAAERAGVSEQQAAAVTRELARAVAEERVFICIDCLGYGEDWTRRDRGHDLPEMSLSLCPACDGTGWTGR